MEKKLFSLFGLLLISSSQIQAADLDWSSAIHKTNEVFIDMNTPVTPGCVIGVIHEGEYIFSNAYGTANLEHNIPLSSKSIFRIASVSKQFTAAAIAILVERGEVDLDVDIHTYLPSLVDYGETVTIRQMLHHISGIPDYEGEDENLQKEDGTPFRFGNEDYYTVEEFFGRVKNLQLILYPEEDFSYSNTAYFFLSQVVERVTGESLREFSAREIFSTLGMNNSFFNDNVNEIVPNRADGYKSLGDSKFEIYMTNLNWTGDGAVYTSLEDFLKWDQNFYDNKLGDGSSDIIAMLETPHPFFDANLYFPTDTFANNEYSPYAWGMFVMDHRGLKVFGHTGGWVGFSSYYLRYPELELSFVLMCNVDSARTAPRINEIRDSYLEVLGVEIE